MDPAGTHVKHLPDGMHVPNVDPAVDDIREYGKNYTRSIVGSMITSGIPYMAVNVACTKIPAAQNILCAPENIGYVAFLAPRLWMFVLSLIGDVLLVKIFCVYESEHAESALLTYASSWMTLLLMSRNSNFALEALCLLGLLAGCFGWPFYNPRPVYWLSATALALGIFLRPAFAVFVCTPLIYLVSLWGKSGVDNLRHARASIEGVAIFSFWVSLWVSVDSIFFGSFKLRFGKTIVTSFDMFVELAFRALSSDPSVGPLNYKGSLLYIPLNASRNILKRSFWNGLLRSTSPGQMFLNLPVVLGPLMILLIRESIEGIKAAAKELMTEVKSATADKKGKKKRSKKSGMSKEREEELLVFFDTIQTTLLLGLLLEVMQDHDRIGVFSLLSLNAVAITCVSSVVFGPGSFSKARYAHFLYSIAMVMFYGMLNHAGVTRTLLAVGAGRGDIIPENARLVVYRGKYGHHTSALGANLKNLTLFDGGDNRLDLMTSLREVKEQPGYDEDRLLVCAPATVDMRDTEFEKIDRIAYGHLSVDDLPENIDGVFKQAGLNLYKFIGDEDEAIIRDNEEAEEEEERQREHSRSKNEA